MRYPITTIPAFEASVMFAQSVDRVGARFNDSKYKAALRGNLSYRFPEQVSSTTPLDIFNYRVSQDFLLRILLKVVLHWFFSSVGWLVSLGQRRCTRASSYLIAYVEDVESLYEAGEDTNTWIYPFPMGLRRQIRYIAFLRRTHRSYRLAGLPYVLSDVFGLIRERTAGAYERLERRASLRHAESLHVLGYRRFLLSNEYDFGALSFARYLRHRGYSVENICHGVGLYFPYHAASEFRFVTVRQRAYYRAVRPCAYLRFHLKSKVAAEPEVCDYGENTLIFCSQRISSQPAFLAAAEDLLLKSIAECLAGTNVDLVYRPHPNQVFSPIFPGWRESCSNNFGKSGAAALVLSFYSTVAVDDLFPGRKVLVSTERIRPDYLFADQVEIVPISDLDHLVRAHFGID